jgi:hypothetical protein
MSQQNQIALPSVYDDFNAQLIALENENKTVVFDYKDKKENKAARSHVASLRKSKTAVNEIHKDAKAEALAECKRIDAGKNMLIKRIEDMIQVHTIPLDQIKAAEDAEKLRIQMEAQAKAEAEAMAIRIEMDHEAAILEDERRTFEAEKEAQELKRQAQIKADDEAAERIAESKAAEIAANNRAIQAEHDKAAALKQAELDKQAAIKRTQDEAKKKAQEDEQRRLNEINRANEEKEARARDVEHRRGIHKAISTTFCLGANISEEQAKAVITMIARGQVPYVKIEY